MIYLQLFISFFKIGLFGFGGGLAIISLIQHEVLAYGWMTEQEFVDIVAISQVTPGPIGINCATYVGYTATHSVWGSALATGAMILPGLIIMLAVCKVYMVLSTKFASNPYFQNTLRYLRFAVLGLIAAAALLLITPATFIDRWSIVLFAAVFVLTVLPQVVPGRQPKVKRIITALSHPILLIVLAGIAGYFLYI
ncbi:MAG: chromate transporter [Paludibacteraceae bacterium]|nr:chromate transporter [Paludibacteraceae bacterium]